MKRIYLSPPHMSGKELGYIKEAFDQNWIAPVGPHLTKFENMVAEYVGSKYAVAVTSGTAGLHLALHALGVKEGDYVICSSLTFAGTVNPIKYLGANPVYIDSDPIYWNMDPTLLETAILNLPEKPKAIIPVHLFGVPCEMDGIMKLAEKYDIPVIEDAAESLGSMYNKKHTGTFGKIGVYSFNGNKLLTTSGGGMIVTDNKELADHMRFLSTQAKDPLPYYWHTQIGYNYRMSNILAAIGIGQIEVIEERIKRTREINQRYREELKDLIFFQEERENDRSNMWLSCAIIPRPNQGDQKTPDQLIEHLEKSNIEARRIWCPMHQQPAYTPAHKYINGNSDILFNHGVCLPSGSNMTDEEFDKVITEIKKFFKK
jgi:dTDP-4-amino-4,6-dideoxygalactose transaminase